MTEGAANAQVVVGMYTPIAADYEELWAPLLRPYGIRLLDALPLAGARRVLDLGCGVGRLLPDIAERAPKALVVGSDLTEGMVRLAPAPFGRAVMDATRLGFADEAFDAVVSAFMLFHLPDPLDALRGIRRVLRPGGGVAIAVWGTGETFPAMTAWDEEFDRLGVPADPAASGPPDGRPLVESPEKLGGLLARAGYVDVRAESAEWLVRWETDAFLDWRRRMGTSRRRMALMEPEAAGDAFARARDHVGALGPEALVHRDEVVLANARAPAAA